MLYLFKARDWELEGDGELSRGLYVAKPLTISGTVVLLLFFFVRWLRCPPMCSNAALSIL